MCEIINIGRLNQCYIDSILRSLKRRGKALLLYLLGGHMDTAIAVLSNNKVVEYTWTFTEEYECDIKEEHGVIYAYRKNSEKHLEFAKDYVINYITPYFIDVYAVSREVMPRVCDGLIIYSDDTMYKIVRTDRIVSNVMEYDLYLNYDAVATSQLKYMYNYEFYDLNLIMYTNEEHIGPVQGIRISQCISSLFKHFDSKTLEPSNIDLYVSPTDSYSDCLVLIGNKMVYMRIANTILEQEITDKKVIDLDSDVSNHFSHKWLCPFNSGVAVMKGRKFKAFSYAIDASDLNHILTK